MKRGSLLAVSAILALCFHSRVALADSSKNYPRGGNVDQFATWAARFNQTGEPFKIEGICQSACTIFLRIKQVCIVPDSTFRFHAGHTRDKAKIAPYPTSVMMNSYNVPLKQYLEKRGAMNQLEFTDIPGSQIIALGYRACP